MTRGGQQPAQESSCLRLRCRPCHVLCLPCSTASLLAAARPRPGVSSGVQQQGQEVQGTCLVGSCGGGGVLACGCAGWEVKGHVLVSLRLRRPSPEPQHNSLSFASTPRLCNKLSSAPPSARSSCSARMSAAWEGGLCTTWNSSLAVPSDASAAKQPACAEVFRSVPSAASANEAPAASSLLRCCALAVCGPAPVLS